jgi:hypothetical protein
VLQGWRCRVFAKTHKIPGSTPALKKKKKGPLTDMSFTLKKKGRDVSGVLK